MILSKYILLDEMMPLNYKCTSSHVIVPQSQIHERIWEICAAFTRKWTDDSTGMN